MQVRSVSVPLGCRPDCSNHVSHFHILPDVGNVVSANVAVDRELTVGMTQDNPMAVARRRPRVQDAPVARGKDAGSRDRTQIDPAVTAWMATVVVHVIARTELAGHADMARQRPAVRVQSFRASRSVEKCFEGRTTRQG
jgi:hypothetical protein